MPLSDWQPLPLVTTGDMWTAAQHNTYIRANQQALYDGLTGGHGAGSDVDMLDGRHATGFVNVTSPPISFTVSVAGWYTIAEGSGRLASGFVILDDSTHRNRFVFNAQWAYGGGDVTRAKIQELEFVKYGNRTIVGARILREDANPDSGIAKLQVYLDPQGASTTYRIYRVDLAPAETAWAPWGLVNPPIQEDAPAGYSPHVWTVAGNDNWHLMKAGDAGGSAWLTAAQKANLFTVTMDGYSYQNPGAAVDADYPLDGGTAAYSTASWGGGNIYLSVSTGAEVAITGVRINVSGDDYEFKIYKWNNVSLAWELLASGGGAYYTSDYEVLFDPPIVTQKLRVWTRNYGDGVNYVNEIHVRVASAIQGVKPGMLVTLKDAAGTVLESYRVSPFRDSIMAPITVAYTNVETIEITKPDGVTPWLFFPRWAVIGGMGDGGVLVLYKE